MLTQSGSIDCNSAQIQSSKVLTVFALITHGMAVLAALLCAQFHLFMIIFIPFILLSAYQSIRLNCLRISKQSIVYYQRISKERWLLKSRAGKTMVGRPTVHAFRSRLFVKMTFQTYPLKRRIELLVAFDAIKPEQYTYLVSSLWDQE